jgi:hypothetical protein
MDTDQMRPDMAMERFAFLVMTRVSPNRFFNIRYLKKRLFFSWA